MKQSDLAIQVKSLRAQLDVLAAKLSEGRGDNGLTLADLHANLSGQSESSQDEIDAIRYRGAPAGFE